MKSQEKNKAYMHPIDLEEKGADYKPRMCNLEYEFFLFLRATV